MMDLAAARLEAEASDSGPGSGGGGGMDKAISGASGWESGRRREESEYSRTGIPRELSLKPAGNQHRVNQPTAETTHHPERGVSKELSLLVKSESLYFLRNCKELHSNKASLSVL